MEDAKKAFNCRGAWYADIANRRGYQPIVFQEDIDRNAKPGEIQVDHGTTDNLTPGAQIAMDLYRHYQYTLDEDFLKEYAYPVMRVSTLKSKAGHITIGCRICLVRDVLFLKPFILRRSFPLHWLVLIKKELKNLKYLNALCDVLIHRASAVFFLI